jgi:hypothetical protein
VLADRVVPIGYAVPDAQLYADLVGYKARVPAPSSRARLAGLVATFAHEHGPCLRAVFAAATRLDVGAPAGVGAVAVVPSTRGRPGPHPLAQMLGLVGSHLLVELVDTGRYRSTLRCVAPDRFVVTRAPSHWGAGVVLLDDVWVTGARVQSAAHALRAAGAPAVVAVVLGRRVRTDWAPTRRLLALHGGIAFDPSTCVLCERQKGSGP